MIVGGCQSASWRPKRIGLPPPQIVGPRSPAHRDNRMEHAPPVKPKDSDSSDRLSLPLKADGTVPHAANIWLFGD